MPNQKPKIKKIIFIVADTLRADFVGLYKKGSSITPNIDLIGKEGVVFEDAYSSATSTDPSITSMMTGKYPASLGLINHGPHVGKKEEKNVSSSVLLSEILSREGYKTIAIDWMGRWHKRGYGKYSGRIQKGSKGNFVLDQIPLFFYLRFFDKMTAKVIDRELFLRAYYAFAKKPQIPYDPADVVIDKALDELSKNKKNKVFLYLHLWDCHTPYTKSKGLHSYFFDDVKKTYADEVKFLDDQIGRLYKYLQDNKLMDETLLVLTSDHGENFSGPGVPFNHEGLTEEIVRIPLIINNKLFSPRKIKTLVQHVDLFPTILDLVKISLMQNVDGISLAPLLLRNKSKVRNNSYFEDVVVRKVNINNSMVRRRGVRNERYKYIQTLRGNRGELNSITPSENLNLEEALYDLGKNYSEEENVLAKNKGIAKLMREDLNSIILATGERRLASVSKLQLKVKKSLEVIQEAAKKYPNGKIAVAWTGGKDSTVLLHLVRLAFNGRIPFKVIFNDSTMEFDEIYEFIEKLKKLWNIDLITIKHSKKELAEFDATHDRERKKELSRLMKITAINFVVKKHKLRGFIAGIRWDEHESRSREKYFSKRSDHMRIHPILHFTEDDIWEYIHHFGVPYVNLYNKGYRSLGEKPFTKKAKKGEGERSGREREKEQLMANLRKLGYW